MAQQGLFGAHGERVQGTQVLAPGREQLAREQRMSWLRAYSAGIQREYADAIVGSSRKRPSRTARASGLARG
jgi:hypothetical protein